MAARLLLLVACFTTLYTVAEEIDDAHHVLEAATAGLTHIVDDAGVDEMKDSLQNDGVSVVGFFAGGYTGNVAFNRYKDLSTDRSWLQHLPVDAHSYGFGYSFDRTCESHVLVFNTSSRINV
jgi:hypothetical protein